MLIILTAFMLIYFYPIINQLRLRIKKSKTMKSIARRISILITLGLVASIGANAQDGGELFKAKCSACHRVDARRVVGPGLEGINEKRTQEWLLTWIKDSQAMIAAGDADAIAIYEEYNKSPMIAFADMTDEEIIAVLAYVDEQNAGSGAVAVEGEGEEAVVEIAAYTEEEAENGKLLFSGKKGFENGGPSCIVCHNVTNNDVMVGGLLAKDLTNVYERMGDAGVSAIVSSPPFPAMAKSYAGKSLTETEVRELTAFFKVADKVSATQDQRSGFGLVVGGGLVGLVIILGLVSILWNNRKKESTKKDIFSRQIKGNDSIES